MELLSLTLYLALALAVGAAGAYVVWRLLDHDELRSLRERVGSLEHRLGEMEMARATTVNTGAGPGETPPPDPPGS